MVGACKIMEAVDSITKKPDEVLTVYKVCYIRVQINENNHLYSGFLVHVVKRATLKQLP